MNVQSYNDIYEKLVSCMVAGQRKVTDFNKGSIISTMFEAVARVTERLYLDTKAGYSQNLRNLAYALFDFKKKQGQKATATVVFSRESAKPMVTIIPIGTKVSSGSFTFITTTTGTIESNAVSSNNISVIADKVGLDYNVAANTITSIDTILSSDVVSVTNALKASGGENEETETQMLKRFKEFINGLQGTNNYGLLAAVLALEGVRSAAVEEHFPPLDNIYNATIYIDDGAGGLTPELKQEIEDVINGDGTIERPGKRATGIQINVVAATPVIVDVSVNCTVYRIEHSVAQFDIEEALREQINGLGVNENVVITSLILKLRQISYVKDVEITSPSSNITINKNQIARLGTVNITLEDY